MKCEACRHISPASLGHTKDSLTTDRLLHLQTREALEQVYLATLSAWDAVRTCPTFDWPDLLLIAEIIPGAQRPLNSCFKFSPVLQLIRAQQYQDVSPLLKSSHGLKGYHFLKRSIGRPARDRSLVVGREASRMSNYKPVHFMYTAAQANSHAHTQSHTLAYC